MEFCKVSRERQSESRHGILREEGELSDDDNDEDILKIGQIFPYPIHDDIASIMTHLERSPSRSSSLGESPHSSSRYGKQKQNYRYSPVDKERSSRNAVSLRHNKHGERKRNYVSERSYDELRRSYDRQSSHSNTPSSKIWENRRFRASSVRPRTPPTRTSPQENHHDELFELVKEQERIRQQLQSLEEEEKRNINISNGEDKPEDEYILDLIERLPNKELGGESLPISPKHGSVPLDHSPEYVGLAGGKEEKGSLEMEDISEDDDFDEQKLRSLALATSARHNQLLARGIQNETVPSKNAEPLSKEEPVVVIPDVEPEMTEPEIVVVLEDEDTVKNTSKDAGVQKESKKKGVPTSSKNSKEKQKSRSKRKKKGSSKQETKRKELVKRGKSILSSREWSQQRKLLKLLALHDPQQAIEKFSKMAKEGTFAAPPKLTGTMGDFKRQKHLPLLSETQSKEKEKQTAVNAKSKCQDVPENKGKEKKGNEKKGTNILEDNYEEVEMEIASDCEEKETSKQSGDPSIESLKLGAEYSQAMQPIPMMPYPPSQMDSALLSSLTPVYPVPPLPLMSLSLENLAGPPVVAPPLPQQPPPLPPPPPPPVSSPFSHKTSPRNTFEQTGFSDTSGINYGYLDSMDPETSAIMPLDTQVFQGLQEKRRDLSPGSVSSSYYNLLEVLSSPIERGMKLKDSAKGQKNRPFSIDDIGSELHRLRKLHEKDVKSFSDRKEDPMPYYPYSDKLDLSKGFWSKTEWKHSIDPTRDIPPVKQKSPPHSPIEYTYSSTREPINFSQDHSYQHDSADDQSSESIDQNCAYIPTPLSSSSSSPSLSQRQQRRRRRSSGRNAISQRDLPVIEEDHSRDENLETDNSDDEDELRKQLLSSLALKRCAATLSELQKETTASSSKSKEIETSDDHESDEEPVPPPVVKRVWGHSTSSPANKIANGIHGNEKDEQSTEEILMSSHPITEMDRCEETEESERIQSLKSRTDAASEINRPNTSLFMDPQLDFTNNNSPSYSEAKISLHESSLAEYNTSNISIVSDQSHKSITLPPVSSQTKMSTVDIVVPPPISSNSVSFEKSSPSVPSLSTPRVQSPSAPRVQSPSAPRVQSPSAPRVQSPSTLLQPVYSTKSALTGSSSVIKTIYSSSQSLPRVKSAMSKNSKDMGQKNQDWMTGSLRTSSPMNDMVESLTGHSSALETKEPVAKHHKKYSPIEMPIHPSVIVPLHPSSDEEEEDAVKSSSEEIDGDSHSQSSNAEMKRLMVEEKSLLTHKKEILADQQYLRRLIAKAGDALKAQRQAEVKRESLQAQITALMEKEKAVDRMAKAHLDLKEKIKKEAREVKNRLLKNKSSFLEKTKSVMVLGLSVIGPDFIPKAIRAIPQSAKLKGGSEPRQVLTKAQEIAKEKMKLQEKEQEIAEKLKVLRETTNSSQPKKRKISSTLIQEKPSDVIHLGQENVEVSLPQKRRRSLLSSDSSKTPNLPMTPNFQKNKATENVTLDVNSGIEDDARSEVSFKMPKGPQLINLRKILMEEKVEKVLSGSVENRSNPGIDLFATFNGILKQTADLNLALRDDNIRTISQEKTASLSYASPLKMLRSYRFSKFYRTKESLSLTSKSFTHKINPVCIMCPYDLQGTCNDDSCQQQHPKDYELTDREVLEDLVSFHPEVTGIRIGATKKDTRKAVGSYVDSFMTKHKDRLTLEEMCLLLTSEVLKVSGQGQALRVQTRLWKPEPKEEKGLSVHLEHQSSLRNLQLFDYEKSRLTDKDVIIGEEDVRYFSVDGTDALSLEAAVLENPQDINLWLQLSARRLADPSRTSRECLDQALNVLARALEANRSNSSLWLQYLILYHRHSEVNDFPQFCQTALEYAPSYELWFMYLSSLKSYHEKEAACQKALDFLCENSIEDDVNGSEDVQKTTSDHIQPDHSQGCCNRDKRSHQVLEMVVYFTNLNILSGRFKIATKFLQSILGMKGSSSTRTTKLQNQLTVCHTLVLWMVYIHLVEWRHLPPDLFIGANENPGRIVTERLSIPWSSKPKLYTPLKSLVSLHKTAMKVWLSSPRDDQDSEKHFVQLVTSLVTLLCSHQCHDEALSLCQKVLSEANLVDVWLMAASVYATKQDSVGVKMIFKEAIEKNTYNCKLQFYQNVFLCGQGKSEEALQNLEHFVISCFHSPTQSLFSLDPNLLFCQLLKLQEGFSLQLAKPKPEVGSNLTQDVFMWLCYCQLLELQGETVETVEVFERSLTQVQSPSDLVLIWQSYITFMLKSNSSSNSSPAMQDLLIRSIISTPMKLSLPFSTSGAGVVDFRHSNQIIEVWLYLLPSDQRLSVIEKCLDYMPGNVPLLLRGLELGVKMKETRRAFCWCKMAAAQQDKPSCLTFWKIASALAHAEGTPKEVEHMLMRCAQVMPLAVSAWKDLLLFEVSREDGEIVSQILSQCKQLGLNIHDYVQTLSAKATIPS